MVGHSDIVWILYCTIIEHYYGHTDIVIGQYKHGIEAVRHLRDKAPKLLSQTLLLINVSCPVFVINADLALLFDVQPSLKPCPKHEMTRRSRPGVERSDSYNALGLLNKGTLARASVTSGDGVSAVLSRRSSYAPSRDEAADDPANDASQEALRDIEPELAIRFKVRASYG